MDEFKYFLDELIKTFRGDIRCFDKLCKEAEDLEKSTSTTQTTVYPSYENLYQKPLPINNFSHKIPRSTIPHTIAIFSIIDVVGGLITGKFNLKSFEGNLKEFFRGTLNEENLKQLRLIYRNKLAHQYLPIKSWRLSAHSSNIDECLFLDADNKCLNVNYLIKLTLVRLDEISSNEDLLNKMNSNFRALEDKQIYNSE
ncbi:MAG: hypothetical protein IM571_07915 [Chitinophagaceae bacterium]|jgi:hypothetical protein|nr:hypothetical protein [Chitinophagaceae bacterium]